ncbi:hypothetical protein [Fundidesulfovibrio terrae]|uniref:hypothetical protein n=1 Tax=Fundidesulfovibrio terrae TaxID=2922866 RepID=UPI001FAF4804|nr:hypothetical protein [Fundidesulfovibrio terrae]
MEAKKDKSREHVSINTELPAIYAGVRPFITDKGTYTNLVYRIHFPKVPFSLVPFYLGAGDNVGVLVILTLDAWNRPILVTTANTCGCYAISIPTEFLPPSSYPDEWPAERVSFFGEHLPSRLPSVGRDDNIQVALRADVHRVMDVRVATKHTRILEAAQKAELLELDSLKTLPSGEGTFTSFYYEHWPLTGYVKGAMKPWETLFLSLPSMDLFIGMDKAYDDAQFRCNKFYTSLKPWNRNSSDLNDFPAYLHFNGWKL